MPDVCFEDIEPGAVSTYGGYRVDRDEMIAFARAFDPQPFHLDEEAAAATPVGRLIASGWYTSAVQMRMLCDAWLERSSILGGLGVEEQLWLGPVAADAVLSVRQTVLDTRVSKSRPGTGIARFRMETLDRGNVVMRHVHLALFGLRSAPAPQPPRPALPALDEPAPRFPPEDPARAPRVYDDVELGRGVDLGTFVFTAERIVSFARRYDPQSFHLDAAAAATGPFGTLVASGWHTAAGWMHCLASRLGRLAATGQPVAIGVSPGFRDLRWLAPVQAGEAIRFTSEPIEKRPLASRPGWGVVSSRNAGWNSRGEMVVAFTGSAFWAMRSGAA